MATDRSRWLSDVGVLLLRTRLQLDDRLLVGVVLVSRVLGRVDQLPGLLVHLDDLGTLGVVGLLASQGVLLKKNQPKKGIML